jgi:hypothetical protein
LIRLSILAVPSVKYEKTGEVLPQHPAGHSQARNLAGFSRSHFRTPLKHLRQEVHFLTEQGVFHDQRLDPAASMQHGGVVAAAKASPDLGQ